MSEVARLLEIVAKYVGKTSRVYRYIAADLMAESEMGLQDRIEFALRDAGFGHDEAYEHARSVIRYQWLSSTPQDEWPPVLLHKELTEDEFDQVLDQEIARHEQK